MVPVAGKTCTFPKLDIIPRHCLTKEAYIDMLATPSRKCPPDCEKKTVLRKLKAISPRIKELAQPTRHRMLITLQEGASILPPALLDNLVRTVEDETCLTPEQAATISRKRKSRGKKKEGRREKWDYKEARKGRRSSTGVASSFTGSFDRDAVSCQYLMAERFVRSILQWKCSLGKSELNDVAQVIVKRLADVLEYSPLGTEDRKSQQIRYLADLISCWVTQVLSEVGQSQEEKLMERCRKKEEEMRADLEAAEEEEEEEEEEEDEDKDGRKYEELGTMEGEEEEEEKEEELAVVVNNAGASYDHPDLFTNISEERLATILQLNVAAVTGISRALLPQMLRRKKGVLINIGSALAVIPAPYLAVYAASKAYIVKLSYDLAAEAEPNGVTVQCVTPGPVATKMSKIKKPTWMAPTAEKFVEASLKTIGLEACTTGYPPHLLMTGFVHGLRCVCEKGALWLISRTMCTIRNRALAKKNREIDSLKKEPSLSAK
ncbi:Estradiol 17-beta-dehydrogenase 12 [Habropoda laboriosa]|uniref:Estradiol 17-beta-dehydrogenase 12 n=1 Tax=Habropoda laboriosa TaxID=597456 RepID=A0A0L7QMX3_9HYME|nr:Estradiol 17-beta-dehydrogenase 12 [Habropoda laboriosa]